MISALTLTAWRNMLTLKVRSLHSYETASDLDYLEACYTLEHLNNFLRKDAKKLPSEGIKSFLLHFFSERASFIQNRNTHYLNDFTNPANQACMVIVMDLAALYSEPYLLYLMPRLRRIPIAHYTSSSYQDELDLKETILSDDGKRLICIPDVLENAVTDGKFRHNSLRYGKEILLTDSERHRLLTRHPCVKIANEAIQDRVNYKLYGGTLGAALNQLILGLKEGGEKKNGEEFIAGSEADEAIVQFYSFLLELNEEMRMLLLRAESEDNFSEEPVILEDIWQRLKEPRTKKACSLMIMHSLPTPTSGSSSQDTIILYRDKFYYSDYLKHLLTLMQLNQHDRLALKNLFKGKSNKHSCNMEEIQLIEGITGRAPQGAQDTTYCVELIADNLNTILQNNLFLYDIDPMTDQNAKESLSSISQRVDDARENMLTGLKTVARQHAYFTENDSELCRLLLNALMNSKRFPLDARNIAYIARTYESAMQSSELAHANGTSQNTEMLRLSKNMVLKIFKECDQELITQAGQRMDESTYRHFFSLSDYQANLTSRKVLRDVSFFESNLPGKRMRLEDSSQLRPD